MKEYANSHENVTSVGDDLLVGADAIARELNWLKPDGTPHRRRIYHLAEKGGFPIHAVPGLGLCARKSALRRFFKQLDRVAVPVSTEVVADR